MATPKKKPVSKKNAASGGATENAPHKKTPAPKKPGTRGRPSNKQKPQFDRELAERRILIARLRTEGWTTQEIAEEVGVARRTVIRDLDKICADLEPLEETARENLRRHILGDMVQQYNDLRLIARGIEDVTHVTRDGDILEAPPGLDARLKAINSLMGVADRIHKWGGMDKEPEPTDWENLSEEEFERELIELLRTSVKKPTDDQ